MSIAVRCYVPAEIQALRVALPIAAVTNIFAFAIESLRGDAMAAWASLCGLALLVLTRWLLPDGITARGKIPVQVLALGLLALGLFSFYGSERMLIDIWLKAWLVLPGVAVLYALNESPVSEWCQCQTNNDQAEQGLGRNRRLMPRIESFGVHAGLLHAVAAILLPVVWILDVAVSPGNILGGKIADAFTTEHFVTVLGGDSFWIWVRNSVTVACGTTVVGVLLAIPAGYAFSRFQFSGRKQAMFLFMLVQMFPGIIILVPYFMVMKTLGLLNTSIGLIIVYSVTALPLCVWMLKGFFDTVPRALEESALLDGCSQLSVFLRIVLPLSLPAVAITAFFSFIGAWNEFLLALVFNTSNEQFTLPVGLAAMIPNSGQLWGDFAAASIVVSIPVVILFVISQKALIQGLSAGSVKG